MKSVVPPELRTRWDFLLLQGVVAGGQIDGMKSFYRCSLPLWMVSLWIPLSAQTVDWLAVPLNGNWFEDLNWDGGVAPSGSGMTARFGASAETEVLISSAGAEIGSIDQVGGAPGYTFRFQGSSQDWEAPSEFVFSGAGITGSAAGSLVWIADSTGGFSLTRFTGGASAGSARFEALHHPDWEGWSSFSFEDNATAAQSVFAFSEYAEVYFSGNASMGSASAVLADWSYVEFAGQATAAQGVFDLKDGASVNFGGESTAANAVFGGEADTDIWFGGNSTAGNALIEGAVDVSFRDNATAGQAVIRTSGLVDFSSFSGAVSAGSSQIEVLSGGELNMSVGSFAHEARIDVRDGGEFSFWGVSLEEAVVQIDAGGTALVSSASDGAQSSWDIAGEVVYRGNGGQAAFVVREGGSLGFHGHFGNAVSPDEAQVVVESGGEVTFALSAVDSTASFHVHSGALFSTAGMNTFHLTVGSISGDGEFIIGSNLAHGLPFEFRTGADNQDAVVGGTITDGDGVARAGNLVKIGGGTLILSGENTYSGYTIVEEGALIVNGSIQSDVTVREGATLGGSGEVGDVLLLSESFLSLGNSAGVLTAKNLEWEAGATVVFDLGAEPVASDFLSLSGVLNGTGEEYLFTFMNNDWQIGMTYDLIEFAGTNINLAHFGFTNGNGFDGHFFWNDPVDPSMLQFQLTAIPEPSVFALIAGLGMAAIVLLSRRGRR